MKAAITIKSNKTGEIGHVFHVESIEPSKDYIARFSKGKGWGYAGRRCKGSELTIIL